MASRSARTALGLLGALTLCATWEAAGQLYGRPRLLPSPSYLVGVSLPSIALYGGAPGPDLRIALGTLAGQFGITLSRVAIGLAFGWFSGAIAGAMAFAAWRRLGWEPVLLALLRACPVFALIPLFVLWFGGSESGVWAYIAVATLVVVASGVFQALGNLPHEYLLLARLLGASPSQVIVTVTLPAVGPEVSATTRNTIGMGWALSLGAEYAGAQSGLGSMAYLAYTYADMGQLAVLAGVYALAGVVVFASWRALDSRLNTWARGARGWREQ